MRIAFRTDSSLQIGTGHLMRCLTLADGLVRRGHTVLFICRELAGNVNALVCERGHRLALLPAPPASGVVTAQENAPAHAAWLGVSQDTDTEQTVAALDRAGVDKLDWLVVDHYALDTRWEAHLRSRCIRLMVIDDLADRPHDCDLLLDQNLGQMPATYAHRVPASSKVLAGPQYALLRPEFAALRQYSLNRRAIPRLECLLVSMGGVDKDNFTGKVLRALKPGPLPPDCRIKVVIGPHAPALEHVRALASEMPWVTEVLVNVWDIAKLMAESDLAIGAAGSTSWERCCLGIPTILFPVASNQISNCAALGKAGAVIALDARVLTGRGQPEWARAIQDAIEKVEPKLHVMSQAGARICDGLGTGRLVNELISENPK
ncbi:UDP-2,4-diacetamido-2,4,6-trideoxy-beta-L-altropyranose hydrolase [Candidatus Thiosymbion oneisti]|uniref:UDP-2,4-diacetamido-2,4, 6-trideoxy-beta-L-altropyranose hydrolase n=1 Tax=Candidatus Thiosymbion oneisti TaxID=589554 RepID=UPI000A4E189A|nr:UDP-2,4-diacetamido-2,4,6-trideoxy-beta-L-altropyranose hydrolase [Candidatus Thiosymbion oneisti]